MSYSQGELLVVGKNAIEIPLNRHAHSAEVEFVDECKVAPCDPKDCDQLEWEVFTRRSGAHFLMIRWDVSGERQIVWKAFF